MRILTSLLAISLTLTLSLPNSSRAAEGMWLLDQIGQLPLAEAGIELTAEQIYSPDDTSLVDAIVSLGASAAFVSPEGLVLTNHHVAFGATQRASREDDYDYLESGFVAFSRQDERRAPGSYAELLIEVRDVTDEIVAARSEGASAVERERIVRGEIEGISAAAEQAGPDLRAEIATLYEGAEYRLYVSRRFEDVRLVYVPPQAIGNYGGEVDNWEWPRHTGDFAFLRVYMAPDGGGREYHPDNIPYRPKRWLSPASSDLDPGDATMILGFPRSTARYTTAAGVEHLLAQAYPAAITLREEMIAVIEAATATLPQGEVVAAGRTRWIYNGLKYRRGVLASMERIGYLETRLSFDEELSRWLEGQGEQNPVEAIDALYTEIEKKLAYDNAIELLAKSAGYPLRYAFDAYHSARERAKLEYLRDPGFSQRGIDRTVKRLPLSYLNVEPTVERALLRLAFEHSHSLPEEQRVGVAEDYIRQHGSLDAAVEAAFSNTRCLDGDFVASLYSMSAPEIKALDDSMLRLAVALYPEYESYDEREESVAARKRELRRDYIAAIRRMKGGRVYPDATGTIRFTYGRVGGYSPGDGLYYTPQTTLSGIVAKATGVKPFDMPPRLGKLHEARDFGPWADPDLDDVPVDFLHAADITGGNSGSAVMNGRGELIGTAFDGNWEALVSDWQYQPATQRTISCDMRYVQFVTERFQGLDWIIEELEAGRQ